MRDEVPNYHTQTHTFSLLLAFNAIAYRLCMGFRVVSELRPLCRALHALCACLPALRAGRGGLGAALRRAPSVERRR